MYQYVVLGIVGMVDVVSVSEIEIIEDISKIMLKIGSNPNIHFESCL